MRNEVKNNPVNLILTAICVFVGVGFISGAEIWFYFARFESGMFIGLIIFACLCFFIVYFALNDSLESDNKSKFKSKVLCLSELLVASAMVSGLMETSRTLFGAWWLLVFLLSTAVMIFVFLSGFKSMIIYNYFVAIFIIFAIISMFLFNNENLSNFALNLRYDFSFKNIFFACIFPIIYIFMNSAEMRPVLAKFNIKNNKKKKCIISLILSLTLILLIFTFSFFLILNKNIATNTMPLLLLFNKQGGVLKFVFLIGMILALISTAIAGLSGAEEKINLTQNDKNFTRIFVILSSLIFGQIPFQFFVKIVYPIIGLFNFLIFILDMVQAVQGKK